MSLEINTSILIQAEPSIVWKTFSAFDTYPVWNPFLTLVKGDFAEGGRLSIIAGGMRFKPTVLIYKAAKQLQWIGRFGLPGIFDGRHNFELVDNGDGTTTFIHSEVFSGILVPVFRKKLLRDTKAGFEAMNQALKERVEA